MTGGDERFEGGIVREAERERLTGVKESTWRRYEKAGKAPKRFPITARTVGWWRCEILAWVAERALKPTPVEQDPAAEDPAPPAYPPLLLTNSKHTKLASFLAGAR